MRFFFERDFDRELEIERGDAPPTETADTVTRDLDARMAEVRAAAYAEGEAAGRAAAEAELRNSTAARHADAMSALSGSLGGFLAEVDRHRETLEIELVDFALAVCERLVPEAVDTLSEPRMRDELHAALRLVQGEGRVRVRVSRELRDAVIADVAGAAGADLSARVEVTGDAALAAGDLRVEWDNGFLDYSFADICEQLISALNTLAGGDRRPAPFRRAANA